MPGSGSLAASNEGRHTVEVLVEDRGLDIAWEWIFSQIRDSVSWKGEELTASTAGDGFEISYLTALGGLWREPSSEFVLQSGRGVYA